MTGAALEASPSRSGITGRLERCHFTIGHPGPGRAGDDCDRGELFGDRLVRLLGASGMDVVTRLMGLILAVVGTQMLIQGAHDAKGLF